MFSIKSDDNKYEYNTTNMCSLTFFKNKLCSYFQIGNLARNRFIIFVSLMISFNFWTNLNLIPFPYNIFFNFQKCKINIKIALESTSNSS